MFVFFVVVFSFVACCFFSFFFFVILNLGPQQWKPQILTSGLPGNSLLPLVLICFSYPLFLRWKALIINLRYFFLSIRVFECYTYSSEHCFSWVSHIVIFSTLILFSVIKLSYILPWDILFGLCRSVLFNFQIFGNLQDLFHLFISSLIPLCWKKCTLYDSSFYKFVKTCFLDLIWSVVNVACAVETMYILLLSVLQKSQDGQVGCLNCSDLSYP